MFELTNEQRPCFGLKPVEPDWVPMVLKASPYHSHTTIAYRDGQTLRKYVASGPNQYVETELHEQLSEDLKYLLPKTSRGKPTLLTAASMEKRGGTGMCLNCTFYRSTYLDLFHHESQNCWYDNRYEVIPLKSIDDFASWVRDWCADTTQEDLDAIAAFAQSKRTHVKFREGDVFRFRINRRLYGYGRILLDYAQMRKRKEPMFDILPGKPTACAVYHLATERRDVTLEELQKLPSLPSVHMMDNRLYYGDFVIIGNLPLREKEDWPILYGGSNDIRSRDVHLQCGHQYRKLPNQSSLFPHDPFKFGSIGFDLRFKLPVLLDCIEAGNNDPYWAAQHPNHNRDLRNPQYRAELEKVCAQIGVTTEDLLV